MKETRESLVITNGKIDNLDYHYDFHIFDGNKTIKCYLLLPGINPHSLIIRAKSNILRLTAVVQKQYVSIFQAKSISIEGKLPFHVLEGVLTTIYENGILEIEMVKTTETD